MLIGTPEETPKDFIKTIDFYSQIDPERYLLYIFYPYPGTNLYQYCLDNKYINFNKNKIVEREDTILNLPTFKREDILYFYESFRYIVPLLKHKKNPIKNIYRQTLLNLLKIYPRQKMLFVPSQIIYFLLRYPIYFLKNSLNYFKPTDKKVFKYKNNNYTRWYN